MLGKPATSLSSFVSGLIRLMSETTVVCVLCSALLRITFSKIISCLTDKFGHSHTVWRVLVLKLNINGLVKQQVIHNNGAYSYHKVENIIKGRFPLCQSHHCFFYEHNRCDF